MLVREPSGALRHANWMEREREGRRVWGAQATRYIQDSQAKLRPRLLPNYKIPNFHQKDAQKESPKRSD